MGYEIKKKDGGDAKSAEPTEEPRVLDIKDFPIVPGATVVAQPRVLDDPDTLLDHKYTGEVLRVYFHPKHGGVVEFVEFGTSNRRTMRAKECRVQAPNTVRAKALAHIRKDGEATVEELVRLIDCTAEALGKALRELAQAGHIRELDKRTRGGRWEAA